MSTEKGTHSDDHDVFIAVPVVCILQLPHLLSIYALAIWISVPLRSPSRSAIGARWLLVLRLLSRTLCSTGPVHLIASGPRRTAARATSWSPRCAGPVRSGVQRSDDILTLLYEPLTLALLTSSIACHHAPGTSDDAQESQHIYSEFCNIYGMQEAYGAASYSPHSRTSATCCSKPS